VHGVGIAGVAGVRQSGPASSLPATLNVASQAPMPMHQYGGDPAVLSANAHSHGSYSGQQPPAARPVNLPDTLNVLSIIDQPPAQRSSYGISGTPGHDGYTSSMPQQPPSNMSASLPQMHYTPDGRPYYYHPGTGQTSWDAPV
jgi:hypothetical protein